MSNEENTAQGALAGSDETTALKAKIALLEAKIAASEGRGDVVDGGFKGEAPRYKLNAPCYIDDTLHEAGTIIDYIGVPNGEMVPLNNAAEKAMQKWLSDLEQGAREAAEHFGRPFRGLISDRGTLIAQQMHDVRTAPERLQLATPVDREKVPQMPHMDQTPKRGRGRPPKSVLAAKPPSVERQRATPEPVSVLGTTHTQAAAGNRVG